MLFVTFSHILILYAVEPLADGTEKTEDEMWNMLVPIRRSRNSSCGERTYDTLVISHANERSDNGSRVSNPPEPHSTVGTRERARSPNNHTSTCSAPTIQPSLHRFYHIFISPHTSRFTRVIFRVLSQTKQN